MSSRFPSKLILPLGFFGIAVGLSLFFVSGRGGDAQLKEAEASYHAGELATTIASRKEAFNKTLELYLTMEEHYEPRFGSGKLYFNIGDTYFQLEEYAWAELYYLRAKALMPRNGKVDGNLSIARNKLSLPNDSISSAFANVFFFHYYLSLSERLQLLFLFILAALFFCSISLWANLRGIKTCITISFFLMAIMLLSVGYTRYISPVEAVLVEASDLYRDAGTEYAKVGERPLPGGTVVQVLEVRPDGKWFKILSPKGDLGYAPQETIRLVGA